MNPELERIRSEMKQKRKKTNKGTEKKRNGFSIYRYLCKALLVVFLTLLVLIFMKKDPQFKTDFYKFVYNSHFSFATFNDVYEKYMGNPLPFKDLLVVDLPASKKRVELNYMTPRIYDDIAIRTSELKSKMKNSNENRSLQITLTTLIKTVDGKVLSPAEIEAFVNNLPMRDTNILLKRLEKINGKVGINTITTIKCSQCGHDILTSFRSTPEFFGPEDDE